jgi:methyl-accepting chemotaxis protein
LHTKKDAIVSIKLKLFFMVGLPIAALVIIFSLGLEQFYAINSGIDKVNTIHLDRATMINADRDAYQAQMAVTMARLKHDMEGLKALESDHDENITQTWDRILGPSVHFTPDMEESLTKFKRFFQDWKSTNEAMFTIAKETYAANTERDASAAKAVASFDAMRTVIDQLGGLASTKLANPALNTAERRATENALDSILNADRDAYQAYVAQLLATHAHDEASVKQLAASFAENMEQTKARVLKGADLLGPAGKALKASFITEFDAWSSLSRTAVTLSADNMGANLRHEELLAQSDNAFTVMRDSINTLGDQEAVLVEHDLTDLDNSISSIVRTYIWVTVACLALAVLVTLFISTRLTASLKRTMHFARSVADGDFSAELTVKGRDEVSQLAEAVKQIPATLSAFRRELTTVAEAVDNGWLRQKADSSSFKGAYKDLVDNANAVADIYLQFMDTVPMPLLTLDTGNTIRFVNKAGASFDDRTPDALAGTKCHDIFKTSDCNTPNCACNKAILEEKDQVAETDAHPGGEDMEIRYMGVPNYTRDGKLVGAFEIVVDQTEIVRSQRKMQALATRAADITTRLAEASSQISEQVDRASRGADIQRGRATEAATAMEEMNSTVLEVARNASSAAENAENARLKSTNGADIVKNVVTAIDSIQTKAMSLKTNMVSLGEKAEDIGRIMNVITDIADQTNLLALNAAIEAARAGEAGRGFAVVADEVRKLAEKTMSATQEVGRAIGEIQSGTRQNVNETEGAVEAVNESTELVSQAGAALAEILDMSEHTADQVRAIATAAEEQSATSEEINRSTEEINTISTETAEAMAQSAHAVRELVALADELHTMIDELRARQTD